MANKLLNSAMMPAEGDYSLRCVTPERFAEILRREPFQSFVGYPETARILRELSGVDVPLCREQAVVLPGDTLLIVRLRYRMVDPKLKGQTAHALDDFEFFTCSYREVK